MNQWKKFFEKKQNRQPLDKLTKRNRILIKVRSEKGGNITDTKDIQNIIMTYLKKPHSTKLENLKETNKFLDAHAKIKPRWAKSFKQACNKQDKSSNKINFYLKLPVPIHSLQNSIEPLKKK